MLDMDNILIRLGSCKKVVSHQILEMKYLNFRDFVKTSASHLLSEFNTRVVTVSEHSSTVVPPSAIVVQAIVSPP